jgi:tetratricopeptide (TPR) repeat protein
MQEGDESAGGSPPADNEQARASYVAARDAFERGQQLNPEDGELVRKAGYLLGLIAIRFGDYREAERRLSNTRRSNYDTPEGLAAGFEEAEVKRRQGKHDEAIHDYGRVLRQAVDMPVYSNPWISLDQLRERAEGAFKEYFAAEDFRHAIEMANALTPLSFEEDALEMQASAHRAEALFLQNKAESQPYIEKAVTLSDAQASWRKGAALYEQLARLRFASRQYPGTVWQGAECYLNGHDYSRAARLLRNYMANEVRRQHPPALTALGEAELALGDPAKALAPLEECI